MCLGILVSICDAFFRGVYGPDTSVHSLPSNVISIDSNLKFINNIGSRLYIDLHKRPIQISIDTHRLTTNPIHPDEHFHIFSEGKIIVDTYKKFLRLRNDNSIFYVDPRNPIEYNNQKYLLVLTEEPVLLENMQEKVEEVHELFKKENPGLNTHALAYNDRGVVIMAKCLFSEGLSIHWYRPSTSEFINDFENNEEGVFINSTRGLFFTIKTENDETVMTINGKPALYIAPSTLLSDKSPDEIHPLSDYCLFVRGCEKV